MICLCVCGCAHVHARDKGKGSERIKEVKQNISRRKVNKKELISWANRTGWPSGPIQPVNPPHQCVTGAAYGGECRSAEFVRGLLSVCSKKTFQHRTELQPTPAAPTKGPEAGIRKRDLA